MREEATECDLEHVSSVASVIEQFRGSDHTNMIVRVTTCILAYLYSSKRREGDSFRTQMGTFI